MAARNNFGCKDSRALFFAFARGVARFDSFERALFSFVQPDFADANLIAVPLGTLALMSNLGALICGFMVPFAAELFNNAAWFFMFAMQWVSEEFTKSPARIFMFRRRHGFQSQFIMRFSSSP